MTIETRADFARRINVRQSYVNKLAEQGRLVFAENGQDIDAEASIKKINESKDPSRQYVAERHAENKSASGPLSDNKEHDLIGQSYGKARAFKEQYAALTARLEYEKALGQVVEKSTVLDAGKELGQMVRNTFENLPDLVAEELAAASSAERVRALLAEHIQIRLKELVATISMRVKKI